MADDIGGPVGPHHAAAISRPGITARLSAMASAIALAASGVSLWETVLKQPQLKIYVGTSISYTRDPWGSYEVFVVPVTIKNSGAQDGAVMSMKLELANAETGQKDVFESAYTADVTWFSGSDNVTNRTKRPKSPFSPISIAGRSAWSGTVLFYSAEAREKKVAEPKSQVSGWLTIATPASEGWLDRAFAKAPPPIAVAFGVPNYLPGALLTGDVARLRVSLGDASAKP